MSPPRFIQPQSFHLTPTNCFQFQLRLMYIRIYIFGHYTDPESINSLLAEALVNNQQQSQTKISQMNDCRTKPARLVMSSHYIGLLGVTRESLGSLILPDSSTLQQNSLVQQLRQFLRLTWLFKAMRNSPFSEQTNGLIAIRNRVRLLIAPIAFRH